MQLWKVTGAGGLLAAFTLVSLDARAAGPADQATAVALFQEARRLAAAGDFEHACPKFVEAQRLFPTAGTLLNLGACYEKLGKLASAWGAYKQAEISARNAGDSERQDAAAKFALAIEGKLSKLTITMAGALTGGIEVRRDGAVVGEGQLGTAVPVDPGEHMIEVTAPKRQGWTTRVQVAAGGASVAVSIPELPPADEAKDAPYWGGQRTTGVVLAGAGLVGIVVGSVFGVKTFSKNSDSLPHCLPNDVTACYAPGVALRDDAYAASRISTGAFIAGGALLAAGAITFFTASSGSPKPQPTGLQKIEVRPVVGMNGGALSLRGAW